MVYIVQLDRGMTVFRWLCAPHISIAKAQGWIEVSKRKPPHELPCEDCEAVKGTGPDGKEPPF